MKTLLCFLQLCFLHHVLFSQVAINTSRTPADASAMLDVASSNKGVLVPRMTTAQRVAISSPAMALLVFDTDTNRLLVF